MTHATFFLSPSGYCIQLASEIESYIPALISDPVDNVGIVEITTAHNLLEEIWLVAIPSTCTRFEGPRPSYFLVMCNLSHTK